MWYLYLLCLISWTHTRIHRHFGESAIEPIYPILTIPQGIYVDNKTYIVYQDRNLDPRIIAYNHSTSSWSNSVKVGTNPLGVDGHGAPSVIRDASGYFYVFFGSHNSLQMVSKSNAPDNIISWSLDTVGIWGNVTYPKPIILPNGDLYLFLRYAGQFSLFKTVDDGITWDFVAHLINMLGGSVGYGSIAVNSDTTKVHYAWCWHKNDILKRVNIYHAYYNISDGNMYNMVDINLGGQIDSTEANDWCLILNTVIDATETNTPAIHLDANDYPYLLFPDSSAGDTYYFEFMYWNGSNWSSVDTITTTDNKFNSGDFILYGSDSAEAYLTTAGEAGRGGDMEKWIWNGSSWSLDAVVLTEGRYWCLNTPNIINNYNPEIKVVFNEEQPTDISKKLRVFAYGDSGFVERDWNE